VIHNPVANMLLGEGVAPMPQMRDMGLTVALGTDSPNNRQDMFEVTKSALLLHRVTTLDAAVISATDVLRMATIDGARALGCEAELGSLEAEKKADVLVVDVHRFHASPMHDPIGTLVYSCTGSDVDTVLVDGRVLVRDGQVLGWDEHRVSGEIQALSGQLRDRALLGSR
jgi:5-methylthioadenosine/S-adenosylhomocysteine deaminase